MKLTIYTVYTKLGKLDFTILRVPKKSLLLNNNYCFSVYMHHYADTVTEGRDTLEQTESRRKNSAWKNEHIISDRGVISSANFVITVI